MKDRGEEKKPKNLKKFCSPSNSKVSRRKYLFLKRGLFDPAFNAGEFRSEKISVFCGLRNKTLNEFPL